MIKIFAIMLSVMLQQNADTLKAGFRFDEKTTGPSTTYTSKDLDHTPAYDIRDAFANIIGARVSEAGSVGRPYSVTFHNGGNIMIDGMPSNLSMEHPLIGQVESVTVIDGLVDAFRYGVGSGFMVNTLLDSVTEKKDIRVSFENAFLSAGRTAQWCNGVDYARMMNQSRANAGLSPTYSEEQIQGFALNDPYNLKTPALDMRDLTLKDSRMSQSSMVQFSGKDGVTVYSGDLYYIHEGDNFKIGPTSDFNSLGARAALKTTLSPRLKLDIRSTLSLDLRRYPNAGYSAGTNSTPPVEFPLVVGENEGMTVYGVSSIFPNNYYASLLESGSQTSKNRFMSLKATAVYDMSHILKGLSSETYAGFMYQAVTVDGQSNDYLANYLSGGNWVASSHQGVKSSAKSVMSTSYYQSLMLNEKLGWERTYGRSKISAQTWARIRDIQQPSVRNHILELSASADYSFADKYLFQFSAYAPASSDYNPKDRFGLNGAVGLGWIASNEDWLKDSGVLDFLKFRIQAGYGALDVNSDRYLLLDNYVKSGSYTSGVSSTEYSWIADSGTSVRKDAAVISRLGNSSITRGRRAGLSGGLDLRALGNRLSATAHASVIRNSGYLAEAGSLLPDFYGMNGITTYINWNSNTISDFNLAIDWSDRIGELEYEIGAWFYKTLTLRDKYLETVIEDYLKTEGTYSSAVLGYVYEGRFADDGEIASSPVQTFDNKVHPGDLKYKDLNDDGKIDSNDRTYILKDASGLGSSFRLSLKYKGFDLFALFRARTGSTINLVGCGYFSGGRGYTNYTVWMRDNIGGDYPRLAYENNNNDYVTSSFWFRNGDFLKLKNLELGYTFNGRGKACTRLFLRGENLFSLDHIKVLDPEYLNAGYSTYAINRTLSAGIKLNIR